PVYWRATPQEALPCLRKPVSSITSTASRSASVSSAYARTKSRSASACQRPRPRIACCRQGPPSPAASARLHPVLRRSGPSSPSRNRPAETATRCCVNNGRIRSFTSRSDAAHSSNATSTPMPTIRDLRTMPDQWSRHQTKRNCNARLCLQSSEPEQAHADGENGEVVDAALFVAGGDTPELLEPVDQPLDAVAFSVGRAVERRVARLVALGRDHRPNAAAPDPPSGGGAAVALVARHPAGPQAGAAAALGPGPGHGVTRVH